MAWEPPLPLSRWILQTEDQADPRRSGPRSAALLGARPHREVRLLTKLPPNTVVHATFFLSVRGLGALDVTCQRFHPVGLTQKACLMRAGMWLPQAESARVERRRNAGRSGWMRCASGGVSAGSAAVAWHRAEPAVPTAPLRWWCEMMAVCVQQV